MILGRAPESRFPLIAFVCVMAVLGVHAWHYRTFMADDAFISLRYADRLLHGLGLTWNDGEAVEGYSNLLWVLGCALLGKLRIDLVAAARVLGFMGTAAAIAALLWTYRGSTTRSVLPGIAGALALALSGPSVIWTVGGLDHPPLPGLPAWGIPLLFPVLDQASLGTILAVWLGYLVIVGGDFFPGQRHFVPAIVVLAYLAASFVAKRISHGGSLRPVLGTGAILAFILLGLQLLDPENVRAYTERWEWDGKVIGEFLANVFGSRRPLLAVDTGGWVPYFSGLPSIDMLGINDRYLAHHRPADFGKGALGHELGNGAYILSRKPDLVLFTRPTGTSGPHFRSGKEIARDSRTVFESTFRLVTFECEYPRLLRSVIWTRAEGGAIGIQRSWGRIQIPGYLFSTNPDSRARLDPSGRIGVAVSLHTPSAF